jgi:hypothetical protein
MHGIPHAPMSTITGRLGRRSCSAGVWGPNVDLSQRWLPILFGRQVTGPIGAEIGDWRRYESRRNRISLFGTEERDANRRRRRGWRPSQTHRSRGDGFAGLPPLPSPVSGEAAWRSAGSVCATHNRSPPVASAVPHCAAGRRRSSPLWANSRRQPSSANIEDRCRFAN